jgi:single-stranded-DNA-specific exonuclease
MRWRYKPVPDEEVTSLSTSIRSSRILAELLLRIGISDPEEARLFLRPRLSNLQDPFALTNLRAAVDRIRQALRSDERIVVLGDYDVDGVTSTVLLVSILQRLGVTPHFIVPRRLEEGYGLSRSAIDRVLDEHAIDLFIAVDCGTNSVEEVAYLREKGIDVIIIDHHRSKEEIPADCILVNPHVLDQPDQPWTNLCTVGLVFKVAHGLLKTLRQEDHLAASEIILKDYLDLVAMGTIADLVPLLEENRILCRVGLRVIQNGHRDGLAALLEISGVKTRDQIRPMDISFRIGPRINASGRLADASLPVAMLLSQDRKFCQESAKLLDDFNRERQEIERQITVDAEEQKEGQLSEASGIILYHEDWHAGVVGIVASRISRKFHRPAIILGSEGDLAKGSGRSIEGVSLVAILQECDDLLVSWGGHPLAVGVALKKENVPAFQRRFDDLVREACRGKRIEPEIEVARWMDLEEVNEGLLEELETLHPFGQANREPLFALRAVVLRTEPEVFLDRHFRFRVVDSSGKRIFGVAWKMADRRPPVGQPIDMVVRIYWNFFNGRKCLQLEMIDWRPSESQGESGSAVG